MTMKNKIASVLFVVMGILMLNSNIALADYISINNASFEDNVVFTKNNGYGSYEVGLIPGWVIDNGIAGVWQPNSIPFPSGVPDGSNVAIINNSGSISQILSDTLIANTTYTLQVYVGNRAGIMNFSIPVIELYAGETLLNDNNSTNPDDGFFNVATVTYSAQAGDANIGHNLKIVFKNAACQQGSCQISFDKVTLDVAKNDTPVPEPATLLLLGLGLMGLAGIRRKLKI